MTGYGRGVFSIGEDAYSVEVRSLNHRYLDVKVKLPERFYALEGKIKDEIKKRYTRGSFAVSVFSESSSAPEIKVNVPVAKAYVEAARELKSATGVNGDVDLPLLFKIKDVFTADRKSIDIEQAWGSLLSGLTAAFGQIDEWRQKEGAALEADLRERLDVLAVHLGKIEERAPEVFAEYTDRLNKKMEKIVGDGVDESRILLEAALFADRSDISEEIVRIKSHVDMFKEYLATNEPVGKRLDFLCQELFREGNTIASKANDAKIKQVAVELKGELERVREQVQNIE